MPWTVGDAKLHTGLANTPSRQKLWAETANHVLDKTGDEAQAIKLANSAVHKDVTDHMHRRMDRTQAKRQRGPRFI